MSQQFRSPYPSGQPEPAQPHGQGYNTPAPPVNRRKREGGEIVLWLVLLGLYLMWHDEVWSLDVRLIVTVAWLALVWLVWFGIR
jgi:hypothetical protein